MADTKPIRRDQLERFITDNETIIRFQNLFATTDQIVNEGGTTIVANNEELEFYIMTRVPC